MERPANGSRRLTALFLCFGLKKIAKGFDPGKVEAAVFKRPPGELARFGQPAPGQTTKAFEHRSNHGSTTMTL